MSRIDRYLDDVLAGMNLSGAQLAAVEREIRSHLERIVAAEMKRYGLSRDEAETDALASLGYPFPPVRRSGLAEGYGWFLFEWITLVAAFLFFLVLTIATDWKQTWYFVLMAVAFGVEMFQSSWERVDVQFADCLGVHTEFHWTRSAASGFSADRFFEKRILSWNTPGGKPSFRP